MKSKKESLKKNSEKHSPSASPMEEQDSGGGTITSMLFSLFLVGLSILFLFGFRQFLKYEKAKENEAPSDEILTLDKSFNARYIIIKNSSQKDLFATDLPGQIEEDSRKLEDGELILVLNKGEYQGKTYYRLQDHTYVEARTSQIQEVVEFIPLEGYIAITYISSSGVHIRAWVDFEADNVVRTVFIGDKVDVVGMVITTDGQSAFRTDDGYYITTDSSYFSDYTNMESKVNSESEEETSSMEDSISIEDSTSMEETTSEKEQGSTQTEQDTKAEEEQASTQEAPTN